MDIRCLLQTLGTSKCFNEFFYIRQGFIAYTAEAENFLREKAPALAKFIEEIARLTDEKNATTAKHFVRLLTRVERPTEDILVKINREWCERERRYLARVGVTKYTEGVLEFIEERAKILTELISLFSCTRKSESLMGLMIMLAFLLRLAEHKDRLEAKRLADVAKQAF